MSPDHFGPEKPAGNLMLLQNLGSIGPERTWFLERCNNSVFHNVPFLSLPRAAKFSGRVESRSRSELSRPPPPQDAPAGFDLRTIKLTEDWTFWWLREESFWYFVGI